MIQVQRRRKSATRQVFLSTHSIALLNDEGIAADEVLMVVPSENGSNVCSGADISEIKQLLETGLTAAEVVIPRTRPDNAAQLSLF